MARKSSFLQGFEVGADMFSRGRAQAMQMQQMRQQALDRELRLERERKADQRADEEWEWRKDERAYQRKQDIAKAAAAAADKKYERDQDALEWQWKKEDRAIQARLNAAKQALAEEQNEQRIIEHRFNIDKLEFEQAQRRQEFEKENQQRLLLREQKQELGQFMEEGKNLLAGDAGHVDFFVREREPIIRANIVGKYGVEVAKTWDAWFDSMLNHKNLEHAKLARKIKSVEQQAQADAIVDQRTSDLKLIQEMRANWNLAYRPDQIGEATQMKNRIKAAQGLADQGELDRTQFPDFEDDHPVIADLENRATIYNRKAAAEAAEKDADSERRLKEAKDLAGWQLDQEGRKLEIKQKFADKTEFDRVARESGNMQWDWNNPAHRAEALTFVQKEKLIEDFVDGGPKALALFNALTPKAGGGYDLDKVAEARAKAAEYKAEMRKPAAGQVNLTEAQSKTLMYGAAMFEANRSLDELARKGYTALSVKDRTLFTAGTLVGMSSEGQQYLAAMSSWNNAKLRRDSGAAITAAEVKNYTETFFPRLGEGAASVEAKAKLRANAYGALKASGGKNMKPFFEDLEKDLSGLATPQVPLSGGGTGGASGQGTRPGFRGGGTPAPQPVPGVDPLPDGADAKTPPPAGWKGHVFDGSSQENYAKYLQLWKEGKIKNGDEFMVWDQRTSSWVKQTVSGIKEPEGPMEEPEPIPEPPLPDKKKPNDSGDLDKQIQMLEEELNKLKKAQGGK